MGEGDIHLEIHEVGKSFGGTRALDGVSIAINAGSVHAFVGENGAGKSTLGKIVAGVFPPDQGQLSLRGEPVSFRSPREALQRGIALVAQEVAVVPQRTVAENVFLGNEPRRVGFVQRRRLLERFEQLVADTGLVVPANAVVGSLPLAMQQQVEILRALARDAALIVFDEPTAALSGDRGPAVPRDRPRPGGRRAHRDPRLALPRRGAQPLRYGHGPARRQGREDRARPRARPRRR